MSNVTKRPARGAKTDSAHVTNSSTAHVTKPVLASTSSSDGRFKLPPGTARTMRSVYLDSTLLEQLRTVAARTRRTMQDVMREGLVLVVAKYAKGSARE